MRDYHINIFYSEEDECYVADIPDLRMCSGFGDTPEDALREVLIAKGLWLETAADEDRPLPEPRYVPAIYLGVGIAMRAPQDVPSDRDAA